MQIFDEFFWKDEKLKIWYDYATFDTSFQKKKTGQLADDSEFLSEIYFSLYSTTNFKTPAIIYFIPLKNLKIVDVDSGRNLSKNE